MNFPLSVLPALALAATMFALQSPAHAATASSAYPMDCTKAQDKARCATLNQRIAACRDKADDAWLGCMYPEEPPVSFTGPAPRDCSTAHDAGLCERHAAALRACRDKHIRAEHRSCMAGQLQAASVRK